MLDRQELKAIMEQVIATGEPYVVSYDLSEQKGYADKNEVHFMRGKRKMDKVRYSHVFLTHPYGKKCSPSEQGTLYGLDEIDELMEDLQRWGTFKGWHESKETIERNKETQRQKEAFYWEADIREVEMVIDGSLGMPMPKDNLNLQHIVKQAFLDCISTGEDVVLKMDLGPGRDSYGDWEEGCGAHVCDYRFCFNPKNESVEVVAFKEEYEMGQVKAGTERPYKLFLKGADRMETFAESFIAHIQKDFGFGE